MNVFRLRIPLAVLALFAATVAAAATETAFLTMTEGRVQ